VTNIGQSEAGRIINLACKAAGVEKQSLGAIKW
jgi:hypothetical protein